MEVQRFPARTSFEIALYALLAPAFVAVLVCGVGLTFQGRYTAVVVLAFVLRGLMWIASASGSEYVFDPETGRLSLERRLAGLTWWESVCTRTQIVAVTVDVTTRNGTSWLYTPVLVLASGVTVPLEPPVLDSRQAANVLAGQAAERFDVRLVPLESASVLHVVVDAGTGRANLVFTKAAVVGSGLVTPP